MRLDLLSTEALERASRLSAAIDAELETRRSAELGRAVMSVVSTAGIDAFAPVTVRGEPASSDNLNHYGKVVGIALASWPAHVSFSAILFGEITNPAWNWTPGLPIFLNGTTLDHTAPNSGFSQRLGIAKASNQMLVDPELPIRL
jgi:hypothetical protein